MSRRANNLRKRLRMFEEQRVGFYTKLMNREKQIEAQCAVYEAAKVAAEKAKRELADRAALTIAVDRPAYHEGRGDVMELRVRMYPEMLYRQYQEKYVPQNGFGNVSDMARMHGHEAGKKITQAIIDYVAKVGAP